MAIGEGFNALAADRRAIEGQGSSNYFNSIAASRAERAMAMESDQRNADMQYRYDALDQAERDRTERLAESRRQQDIYEQRDARDYQANQSRYFDTINDRKDERAFRDKQFDLTKEEAGYRRQDYQDRQSDKLSIAAQKAADAQSEYEDGLDRQTIASNHALAQSDYFSKVARKDPNKADQAMARAKEWSDKAKALSPDSLRDKYLRKNPDLGYDPDEGFFSRLVREKNPKPDPTDPSSGEMDWDKFDKGMESQRQAAPPVYRTDADVKLAVKSGTLTKEEAKRILQTQFGYL